jgi:hypothetical protein
MSRRKIASVTLMTALSTQAFALDLPRVYKLFGGDAEPGPSSDAPASKPDAGSLECPEVLVETGASSMRFPAGADGENVRYQLSLGPIARECALDGNNISIKVGVAGAAILGPLGQPGSYSGNLRVVVRRQKDEAVLGEKTFKVGATVPPGATRGEFRIVSDPFIVPFVSQRAADDYEILVGFTQGPESGDKPQKARKRRRG